MKADETLIFSFVDLMLSAWLRELADLGMGQAEVTPVEAETSVTHLPDVARRKEAPSERWG